MATALLALPTHGLADTPEAQAAAKMAERLPDAQVLSFTGDNLVTLHPRAPKDETGQARFRRSMVFLPGSKIVDGGKEVGWIDIDGTVHCTHRTLTTHHATAYEPYGTMISRSTYETTKPLQANDLETMMAAYLCDGHRVEGAQLVPASQGVRIGSIRMILARKAAHKPEGQKPDTQSK